MWQALIYIYIYIYMFALLFYSAKQSAAPFQASRTEEGEISPPTSISPFAFDLNAPMP